MSKFLLSLFFVCATSLVWSQDSQQEKLEQRKAQIQQEIKENERLLQSVKKKEKSAVSVMAIQEKKIALKENLIKTTEKQAKLLSNDMYINQVEINKLKKELKVLKEDYAKMIVKSYKSRSEESRAMFLLSSKNFQQAYKRLQYMKQYTSFRKIQGEEINVKSKELSVYNQKLEVQKTAKQKLIEEKEKERLSLEQEKKEQEKIVNSIKKDKNKIANDIKKKQQEARNIDKQIDRLIRQAIAEANRKAAAERAKQKAAATAAAKEKKAAAAAAAKELANANKSGKTIKTVAKAVVEEEPEEEAKKPISSTKIDLTPEAKIVADNFRANKGRLPYPVERGKITLGFGNQAHPVYKSLMVHNSGVEITTDQGATARAVFDGVVTSVFDLTKVTKAVMIQHGDYFTVYQNLSSVNVSTGDKVTRKQALGRIRSNGETGKTVLKFLIYQNTSYINPAGWLSN
ncbi:murein hydrolase activator EnvC family protein [Flavobacterium ammonificans]|jgi:septal ring factor EnvC (AmiA/AmiB activator)|uniref:murein hydrolase activator EnvC family protein n=1 Tax=Flavobacterium ammonificans TaxID=1751056 RepID=UPI001E63FB92|nr:peptidoglycan DD-metalloendopeptidase family protein [Flavobacterium ammonificans]BDB56233.1 peptidase M23 [Flavobacterium ammonificans]